jgi:hypothetical protein
MKINKYLTKCNYNTYEIIGTTILFQVVLLYKYWNVIADVIDIVLILLLGLGMGYGLNKIHNFIFKKKKVNV